MLRPSAVSNLLCCLDGVLAPDTVKPQRVIADTTYGTADNIRELEESGIRAYVPRPDWDQRTPYYGTSLFTDDVEHDRYLGPKDAVRRRRQASAGEEKV